MGAGRRSMWPCVRCHCSGGRGGGFDPHGAQRPADGCSGRCRLDRHRHGGAASRPLAVARALRRRRAGGLCGGPHPQRETVVGSGRLARRAAHDADRRPDNRAALRRLFARRHATAATSSRGAGNALPPDPAGLVQPRARVGGRSAHPWARTPPCAAGGVSRLDGGRSGPRRPAGRLRGSDRVGPAHARGRPLVDRSAPARHPALRRRPCGLDPRHRGPASMGRRPCRCAPGRSGRGALCRSGAKRPVGDCLCGRPPDHRRPAWYAAHPLDGAQPLGRGGHQGRHLRRRLRGVAAGGRDRLQDARCRGGGPQPAGAGRRHRRRPPVPFDSDDRRQRRWNAALLRPAQGGLWPGTRVCARRGGGRGRGPRLVVGPAQPGRPVPFSRHVRGGRGGLCGRRPAGRCAPAGEGPPQGHADLARLCDRGAARWPRGAARSAGISMPPRSAS